MIELLHASKQYKNGVNALNDINLKIDQGEFVYIIGPTGSGKSTLIKLLDGEEVPSSGSVHVVGIDIGKLKHSKVPLYRRNIGVVFQDFRLLPRKTVFENISYALEVISMKKDLIRHRVRQVMNLVGLDDKGSSFPSFNAATILLWAWSLPVYKTPLILTTSPHFNFSISSLVHGVFNSIIISPSIFL